MAVSEVHIGKFGVVILGVSCTHQNWAQYSISSIGHMQHNARIVLLHCLGQIFQMFTISISILRVMSFPSDCDFASVEHVNGKHLHPILSELTATPFFRYFKVNLYCDCPFWPDDGMCSLRDCSVCECPNSEVPEQFLLADGKISLAECKGEYLFDIEHDLKQQKNWIYPGKQAWLSLW